MLKTVMIDVTQKHIEEGKIMNCRECPVALAVLDVIKDDFEVSASTYNIGIQFRRKLGKGWGKTIYHARTPEQAYRFMGRFDAGRFVEPFSFSIDLPEEVVKDGR